MRSRLERTRSWLATIPRWELYSVCGAMLAAAALVVIYVLASRPNLLAGDQAEYNDMGVFFTQGKPWWGQAPFGIAHASIFRPPVYPLWTGFWYEILGPSPTKLTLLQSVLGALTVGLSWLLARRLFGARPALAVAWIVAIFPFVWMWFGLLYTEALAIPLMVLTLLVFLERPPTLRLAAATGTLLGLALMIRPTSVFVFLGVLASFVLATGWKQGIKLTVVAVGVAALAITPWAIRNAVVSDTFVPLSAQDASIYGTFNSVSASDEQSPYAWRPSTPEFQKLIDQGINTDSEYRAKAIDLGTQYIADHPFSVAEAFYWNGLTRLWDVRRPSNSLAEVPFEGRSRALTKIGLGMHYVLLPLALIGLWRHRRRRTLVVPLLAIALGASLVFTLASGTRYRAPLEPAIVVMAVAAFVAPGRETTGSSVDGLRAAPGSA